MGAEPVRPFLWAAKLAGHSGRELSQFRRRGGKANEVVGFRSSWSEQSAEQPSIGLDG